MKLSGNKRQHHAQPLLRFDWQFAATKTILFYVTVLKFGVTVHLTRISAGPCQMLRVMACPTAGWGAMISVTVQQAAHNGCFRPSGPETAATRIISWFVLILRAHPLWFRRGPNLKFEKKISFKLFPPLASSSPAWDCSAYKCIR